MKTLKTLAYAALIGTTLSFAACSDDDTPTGEQVVRGDKACRIESFALNLGEETLTGDVYDYDKSIDLAYLVTQQVAMRTATATIKLSEGATVSPDPSIVADYTQPIVFTVTAPDGKTTRSYTTKPVEKVVETYTKLSTLIAKTATEIGAGDGATYSQIGVSGDKVVIGTKVFDGKTFAAVGSLNMGGYDGLKITSLANDEAGHLVASLSSDGGAETTPVKIVCWKDGYNQPGTTIIESTTAIGYLVNVGGNLVSGKGLLTAMGARVATGPHFCWEFIDGVRTSFYSILTGSASNDGSWSQQVCACSGEVTGTWFMWDAVAGGHNVTTWSGWSGSGSITMTTLVGAAIAGPNNWGNYTMGSLKAFTFNDKPYGAIFTSGWPSVYISIVDGNNEFLLNPSDATIAFPADGTRTVGTYVFNEKENCGYVYALVPGCAVRAWKLEIAIL